MKSVAMLKFAFSVLVWSVLHVDNVYGQINEDLVKELYKTYKDAVSSESSSSLRRLFRNDREYNIHVKRLKEVNGFKKHNLLIKQVLRSVNNPIIYINNPIESKVPNSFLTLDEFKRIFTERAEKYKNITNISKKTITNKAATNRKPTKIINKVKKITKKTTKLVKTTPVTNNMSFKKNKNEYKTQSGKLKILSKNTVKIANTIPINSETSIIESKSSEIPNRTDLSGTVSSTISTLKTNETHIDPVLDISITQPLNTTPDHTIRKNVSILSTLNENAKTTIKDVISITEYVTNYTLENKETIQTKITTVEDESSSSFTSELILNEQSKDIISSTVMTTELIPQEERKSGMIQDERLKVNMSRTVMTELIPQEETNSEMIHDEQLKIDMSSTVMTTELIPQEEIKTSTVSRQTTTSTTTKSKRRTLGRPMVFMGR